MKVNFMSKIKYLFVSILLVLPIIGCDQQNTDATNSTLTEIRDAGVLRVGTTGDYLPFSYYFEGELMGIDIELAKDLASSLNVKLEFVKTSWPTLMDDLMADQYDIGMSGITITEDREKIAMFSQPMHEGGKAAIARDEDRDRFYTIEAINQPDVKVIFNPGGTNEQFARSNFPNAKLIENPENITVFEKIISGDADVMVTDAIETIIQQRIHPELDAVNPDSPFNRSEKAYLFQKDEDFKAYLDQWIKGLKSTRKIEVVFASQLDQSANTVSKE